MQKIDFVQFFKSAIIQTIHQYDIKDRFFQLIQSLRVIISIAKRDHYIYIRNFDFEKIKSTFKDERNVYLENIDKGIESISKQVASFPLTFAASIFAANQVKGKPFVLILILGAYIVYTIIARKILTVSSTSIKQIEGDVNTESEKLKKEYEVIFKDFEPDFEKIRTKITNVNLLISNLNVALVSLLIAFCVFCAYEVFFVDHSLDVVK